MNNMENKTERKELSLDEMEAVCAGSWLGMIWNKIKSFGGGSGSGSGSVDIADGQ